MIILAVDYGDVRTGVAVCDRLELLASPVEVVTQPDAALLIDRLCAIAAQLQAELIVVGLPKNMDGSEGGRADACREFAQALEQKSGIQTVLRDERLTTVSAHQALNVTNTRGKKRKAVVDAVSAVMILEDYLRYRNNMR